MKHFYRIDDVSDGELDGLVRNTLSLWSKPAIMPAPTSAQAVALLFFENSTRSLLSFESACQLSGYRYLKLDPTTSSLSKGESIRDTLEVLRDYGVRCVVIRSRDENLFPELSSVSDLSFINAGEGREAHPTQALGDLVTLCHQCGIHTAFGLSSKVMAIVGDLRHSRVAKSWARLATRVGMKLRFVSPEQWAPGSWAGDHPHFDSLEAGLEGADFVMALRVQNERHDESEVLPEGTLGHFRIQELHLKGRPLLHPGPINWGVELDPPLHEYENSLISPQRIGCMRLRMVLIREILSN